MPIYEYACSAHGGFELLQPITASEEARCPTCGEMSGRRVSLFSFRTSGLLLFTTHDGKVLDSRPDHRIRPKAGEPYPIGG